MVSIAAAVLAEANYLDTGLLCYKTVFGTQSMDGSGGVIGLDLPSGLAFRAQQDHPADQAWIGKDPAFDSDKSNYLPGPHHWSDDPVYCIGVSGATSLLLQQLGNATAVGVQRRCLFLPI